MVAVNISNRYLDLEPVMERAGTAFGKKTLDFDLDPEADDLLCNVSSWVLFVDPQRPLPNILKVRQSSSSALWFQNLDR